MIIYTAPWCPDCRVAKGYLQRRGVPFQEIGVDRVPGAAERVVQWSGGYRTVPTLVIGDRVIVDWDRRAVEDALRRLTIPSGS